MKSRSPLTVCLPLVLFAGACAFSLPTLIIAFVWMTIGVMALGHRSLESFPSLSVKRKWLRGYRAAFVWFYHLAWWPWYMRSSIRHIAVQFAASLHRTKNPMGQKQDMSSKRRVDYDRD